MATYNGADYVVEQIKSIQNQTYSDFNIIISDDNSTDNTVEIITNMAKADSRIKININRGSSGVVGNFNNALNLVTADYIMFSDQDDYWLQDKIEMMLGILENNANNQPALAFSDLTVVDSNLNIISRSYYSSNKLNPMNNMDVRFLRWKSTCYGCTVIMNKKLLDLVGLVPDYASMHDHWFAYKSATLGAIYYNPSPTIMYRQHMNNVVGAHSNNIIDKIKRYKKTFSSIKKSVASASSIYKKETGESKVSAKSKLIFIQKNIMPFMHERCFYSVFFAIIWIIYG